MLCGFFFFFLMSIFKQSRQRFGRFAFSKHGSKLLAHLFSATACGACINNMTCIRQTVTVTTQHFLNISHFQKTLLILLNLYSTLVLMYSAGLWEAWSLSQGSHWSTLKPGSTKRTRKLHAHKPEAGFKPLTLEVGYHAAPKCFIVNIYILIYVSLGYILFRIKRISVYN